MALHHRAHWRSNLVLLYLRDEHLTGLTQWGWDNMATIFRMTFWNRFSLMKIYEFRLKFHWSLFQGIQLTIFQHWFRSWFGADQATNHYLNQWWLVYRCIYASPGLNELNWGDTKWPSDTIFGHVLLANFGLGNECWGQIRICICKYKYKYKYGVFVFVFVFDQISNHVFVFVFDPSYLVYLTNTFSNTLFPGPFSEHKFMEKDLHEYSL